MPEGDAFMRLSACFYSQDLYLASQNRTKIYQKCIRPRCSSGAVSQGDWLRGPRCLSVGAGLLVGRAEGAQGLVLLTGGKIRAMFTKLIGIILIYVHQIIMLSTFSSVQFSRSIVSDSLQSHEPQHARPPCPSPTLWSTQTHVH